ncbi:dipeptidase [Burkholderia cenocepacia]|uniref:dipeptidase n=1 Tax=Burkholderia cenocepacia TaxID=95486 RepID=UPI002ABDA04C|nr:membrane dipeptidase [Burkholderia cenocepacia]
MSNLDKGSKIVRESIVCDMTFPFFAPGDPVRRLALPGLLRNAGLTYVSFTVVDDEPDVAKAFTALAECRRFFQNQVDVCVLVETAEDIVLAKRAGKLGVGFHFQGTLPIGRNLDLIEAYYKLGIRHMLLAYNQKNFVADGCHEMGQGGLSRFGRMVIDEMNRVGMFVDVAHTGYQASMEAIEHSNRPVICSHGNIWELHNHPRCYRDDQIRAIARSGGVFGLTGMSIFTGDDEASAAGFARQIDYVVQLAGIESVGFGLDYVFDLPAITALAAKNATHWPKDGGYTRQDIKQLEPTSLNDVADELLTMGYSDSDLRLVFGGNWLRLMRTVWK